MPKLTGAQIIWEGLLNEGVEVVFGYPGGAIISTYDALPDYPIRHILTRHEQGAAHAADGYARASGKVGVAMATSGPGSTNLTTGIATAMMDSSPVVFITGQVPTTSIGTDAFQETDTTGITLPITKHNYLVTDVRELPRIIHEAFYIARSGRPGPVLIDVPKDVQSDETEFVYPTGPVKLPGYRPRPTSMAQNLQDAVELINGAKRPLILAGQGVIKSGAMREVLEFAEKTHTPIAVTLLGIGGVPGDHPLFLGMMGMHGEAYVNYAIQQADLLLAFGMRFDDRITGDIDTFSPNSRKIHIEIDPAELNKVIQVDVGIIGDLKTVLSQIIPHVEEADHSDWIAQIEEWRKESRERDILNHDLGDALVGQFVIRKLWEVTGGDAIIVTDVGQHQMWAVQYYQYKRPRTLISSGGMGTMGFGLPASVGAKVARPDEEVWLVAGDGGFQMTMPELGTVAQENLNLKIAIINNGYLGMVRQWQELFYNKRYSATPILSPDFTKIAEAYGIRAFVVKHPDEVVPTLEAARKHDGPVVIDFHVEKEENVFPMVPAGEPIHEMLRRPKPA